MSVCIEYLENGFSKVLTHTTLAGRSLDKFSFALRALAYRPPKCDV